MARRGRPPGGEEQRRRILGAVMPLVAEHGIDAVRLADVAKASGVSVGMIQHYFGSRDALLDRAFHDYCMSVVSRIRAAADSADEPWERVVALCRTAVASPRMRQRAVTWVDFVGQASRNAARRRVVQQVYVAWTEALRVVVADGAAKGVFELHDTPEVVAEQLTATVDGLDVAVAMRLRRADQAWREQRLVGTARALLGVG